MAQEGEEMVRGPRFELGTPIFSAGCLKRRRGHKSLRHNLGSSPHSCKSFTALHGVMYTVDGLGGGVRPLETCFLPENPVLSMITSVVN